MKDVYYLVIFSLFFISCNSVLIKNERKDNFKIIFGSCNDQKKETNLWNELQNEHANYFLWLGDIIYPEKDNLVSIKEGFEKLKNDTVYQKFTKSTKILGTWDDHDYGLNDGGIENPIKDSVKIVLLNFLNIPKKDKLRSHLGMYSSHNVAKGKIKIILLDTRYFRTGLTKSKDPNKRYEPNKFGKGSMLGKQQWEWLDEELKDSGIDFFIIVSSVQVLNNSHAYEKWGNMPHERERLLTLLNKIPQQTILISGDRHFSEISKKGRLLEMTSSGLNKNYSGNNERNPLRVSKFVNEPTYGVLEWDEKKKVITLKMKGKKQIVYDLYQIKNK